MLWDFSISTTFGLLARTWPFILARLLVYLAVAVAYVAVTGMGAAVGWGIGTVGDEGFQAGAAFWGGLAGFGLISIALYLAREWFLYMLKAGHIAVMVEAMEGQPLPEGRGQLSHAQAVVRERFAEANVLFVVDQLIKGVVRAVTGIVDFATYLLPVPGLQGIARFARTVVSVAVGFVDEVILAHNIRVRSANPFASAQDALVLYAQNAVYILRNAIWVALFVWGFTFFGFLILLAPAVGIAYAFPGGMSGFGVALAVVFAICLKAALFEPFAIASLMQVYFRATEGQAPRADWRAHLDEVSDKFRDLGARARDHVAAPAAEPAPASPGPVG